ncbi:spermatogenesis associated 2-like [Myripristis murdjan]|uniref:Spermatogenesis-associated protein 2 PUB-like domain-containing protein n=1 Tax=Myripristis murdjan TaxID=586833 RepID=A0A667X712_9TELE|nr:spermatogenesis-associated protein 2-like protein [Myripristis murdjan]XP_029908983.1 spermatogenesis-associated protein 2-like protein [Myripristis murdjan]
MSVLGQRARELVNGYDASLEQRIVGGGSSLVCKDEELCKQVERLLKDGDAQETHCLGLDPLQVMEESLMATAAIGGRAKARGGLQGLAKAFEVLEQAALNLYLGPWREEYKVVKMYSGMFTHYIKPVLPMPQILKVFGLLGYQPCSGRHEQLRRQSPGASSASPGNLLHLSCAFFLARCECRLLLSALGKHAGEAEWELSLVRERQRGCSLQVALESTWTALDCTSALKESPLELSGMNGELDLDLYTEGNSEKEVAIKDTDSPQSLSWVTLNSTLPPAMETQSNGVTSPFSLSTSPTKDPVCVSTLNYQLTKTSPMGSGTTGHLSAATTQAGQPYEESKLAFDRADSQSRGLTAQAMGILKSRASPPSEARCVCSCVQSDRLYGQHCITCNTFHNMTCALLKSCQSKGHSLSLSDTTGEDMKESGSLHRGSLREGGVSSSRELSQSPQPIPFHDCCDPAHPNPDFTCVSCWVFHSGACRGLEHCQTLHEVQKLGVCSCGKRCVRNPLVLCRYCGAEYCNDCWYRRPVECACGQTFDQSSSV